MFFSFTYFSYVFFFFFSSRRRHTRLTCDWSSDVCSSDVGAVDEARRQLEAELGGDAEVHGEGEAVRLLDRQLAGIGALEDARDIVAGATPQREKIRAEADDAALARHEVPLADRRHPF